jgi:hypothetical protein
VALERGLQNRTCEVAAADACRTASCARFVAPDFLSAEDSAALLELAERTMQLGGGAGPVTVLDLHKGALSLGEHFVDVYRVLEHRQRRLQRAHVELLRRVKDRVAAEIEQRFGVRGVLLTSPSFFSRINAREPRTPHDEYFHEHVDRLQYGSFVYTALLYLNDQGRDYDGGTFTFVDADDARNVTVTPRRGMLNAFTSGAENVHRVNRVTRGVRYALTIAFTCSKEFAVEHFMPRVNAFVD